MEHAMRNAQGDDDSALRLYFDDISASTPLTREREVELAERIRMGDLPARDELVQANLRFVIDVAKKYQNRGLALADLISAGNVGLVTAAERFDGTRGFKFISYAVWWIKQSILQTIADHGRTVRMPLNKHALLKNIARAARRLGQGRESEPGVDEIAAELELAPEDVLETMMSARSVRSLDETFEEDDERSLMNMLADDDQAAPDFDVMADSSKMQIRHILSSLDERELRIIYLYFGLDCDETMTLEEIGGTMNLTRERVRQLKERALSKLRHPSRYHALMAICDETEVF